MLFSRIFGNVDRGTLWKVLKEKGLLRRIERIYERMEVTIRTNNGLSGSFRMGKGVRQGCALSPLLFNLYMAGINEMLKAREIRGVEISRGRIWNLAYVDDIVLLAKNKEVLEDMIGMFRKFLRNLELNVGKSKVLVFNRGNNEKRKDGNGGMKG